MGKTIMVVDDCDSLRLVIALTLKGAGYEVIEAADGQDALSKLVGQKIHLIISDYNMPNMDGITFVRHTKAMPAYQSTPVIMISAESQEHKIQEGKAAGAHAWMIKPVESAQMLHAVSTLILS